MQSLRTGKLSIDVAWLLVVKAGIALLRRQAVASLYIPLYTTALSYILVSIRHTASSARPL
jgi:hypothetical protein